MGERVTCRHFVLNNYNKFHDQVHLQLFQYFLQFFRQVEFLKKIIYSKLKQNIKFLFLYYIQLVLNVVYISVEYISI